eukprot:gnl/TRDRNA2_/TRDRNA2_81216_c1_seq1.p2 gnl/TRDRNA2_/TRDRNA2_81216_c1~~gnl/TRDRNA2_/TRDRNA2_81216_c1_seq1.p2  ORF type:complete len:232 (+),score=24.28 gnl/TRDRNA2_/TRDRNA2_81216_c1_seq1:96-791(+)
MSSPRPRAQWWLSGAHAGDAVTGIGIQRAASCPCAGFCAGKAKMLPFAFARMPGGAEFVRLAADASPCGTSIAGEGARTTAEAIDGAGEKADSGDAKGRVLSDAAEPLGCQAAAGDLLSGEGWCNEEDMPFASGTGAYDASVPIAAWLAGRWIDRGVEAPRGSATGSCLTRVTVISPWVPLGGGDGVRALQGLASLRIATIGTGIDPRPCVLGDARGGEGLLWAVSDGKLS